nr:hypothetical protein CFP56_72013 [Quercus suber]
MITCDAKTYQEEVMAHRKHAEYLNKKIEMYDELAIVVGKDTVTGGFFKSYVDIENEPDNGDSVEFVADNVEEGVVEKGKNAVESSTTGSGIFESRKRGRAPSNADDSVLTDLSDQLKEIAMALKEINRGSMDYITLYNEVMAIMADGYSEDMLATAFDHLCENEKAARGFLAKNARLRKLWLDGFLSNPLDFTNPNMPLYGHLSSIDSTGKSMRLTWVSGDEKPQQVQYGDGMSQNSVVTTFTQDDMCSKPSEVVPNQAPVVELSEQGPAREVQPATVTKNGVEGSNGGEEADLVTDVTESNEGGRLSESNLEPELLPINDPISNGLSPIKAPLIVGKEVNAMSLNREAVDLAKLFEIKINEIDEILNIPSQTLVFNGYSMLGNYDGNNSHANPSRPIMENMVHDPEVNAPPTSKVTGSHAAIRLSTRGRGNKHFMKKAVGTKEQSKLTGGKRSGEAHLELLSKRRVVSKDDKNCSNSMVEAEA